MEEARAVLENDGSTNTSRMEDFPKTTASQDILEEISPLPSSSNKDRKRKESVQVKRSKLITPRTSKDLKTKTKMELKSEEDKKTHCIICAETFEEDWIQRQICEGRFYPAKIRITCILKQIPLTPDWVRCHLVRISWTLLYIFLQKPAGVVSPKLSGIYPNTVGEKIPIAAATWTIL
ncbi:hypothetical protein AVEN_208048-1 [Araneus ventricosus]|uniref:Uncharacterized protein n=1 Tax=Araneus ventricosus TaxID=182803 RepID=A0A4Y2F234_ARAVE|nr:hypothetical protein AVEN_208048-1 [Araneus ventricosus]